jgi:hypothetical protein
MDKVRLTAVLAFALLFALGCGEDPEDLLANRWEESSWFYEKLDQPPNEVRRFEGIRIEAFEGRTVVRHEAEYWRFFSDRSFEIALKDGTQRSGRWRLKGRGHILTLRYSSGEVEVYDIKTLTPDELVLHFDMGMEIRGIARLGFSRTRGVEQQREGSARNQHGPVPRLKQSS